MNQLSLPHMDMSLVEDTGSPPPRPRRIYCNRNLRLDQIEMVGFDMDYTLAIYRQNEIDRLSIEATAKKLVERGYPESLLTMPYRTDFPIRGLLIDKKLGNTLKMDRHRYVKKAYHGMSELPREERRQLYQSKRLRGGTGRYHWVDTLYALSEVSMYAAAVDELERTGIPIDYTQLFVDVRACIDLAHQDGSILDHIYADLPRYTIADPELGSTLHKLRSSGKRLFLLTNSRPAYTERMMSYLLDGPHSHYPSWRHYFDIVITSAGKPAYFTGQNPHQEFMDDGALRPVTEFEHGKMYVGGCIEEFERLAGTGGDRILYVGDHIFGDVLRAKKESAWRTVMVIQEMNDELRVLDQCQADLERIDTLHQIRGTLHEELAYRQGQLRLIQQALERISTNLQRTTSVAESVAELQSARVNHKRSAERIRERLRTVEKENSELEDRVDLAFHPFWGSLFKVGPEVSSFGDQVEEYACLYTDRVSNLGMVSPMHYFRSPRHRMPHDLVYGVK